MISTIDDPLGILALTILKPKKIIQDLLKNNIDWDEHKLHHLLV